MISSSEGRFQSQNRSPDVSSQTSISPRGPLLIASCRSGAYLARQVFGFYQERLSEVEAGDDLIYLENIDDRFSDSETYVRLERDVSGRDVFLFQAIVDPMSGRSIDDNYAAFLIATRAFREWGANHVTALLPYLAYARQDKPTLDEREPTTAKLMADMSLAAGVDRLVIWHPHSPRIQGFYGSMPVVQLEAFELFARVFRPYQGRQDVVLVAPDLGASKFVARMGRILNLDSAIASKYRPRPEVAEIEEVIGDFSGKVVAIVLDDMISSGGTVYSLVKTLISKKGIREVHLGVSHNLCLEIARERLWELHQNYGLKEVLVTNSIPQTAAFLDWTFYSVEDLSSVFAEVINRIHFNSPVTNVS